MPKQVNPSPNEWFENTLNFHKANSYYCATHTVAGMCAFNISGIHHQSVHDWEGLKTEVKRGHGIAKRLTSSG